MSFLISPYRYGYTPTDANAIAYIAAVEAADGIGLEPGVRQAIDNFIIGCKADGIWNAIKASCILAGARTLSGALVPLAGAAPTNNNFVSADYNRKTGLGNAANATKYLLTSLAYNAVPSNNEHLAIFKSVAGSGDQNFIGGGTTSPACGSRLGYVAGLARFDMQSNFLDSYGATNATAFVGSSRDNSSTINYRQASVTTSANQTSQTRANTSANYGVFCANYSDLGIISISKSRFAFYSIGESLNLALLDTRVTTLINAIAAAIP